MVNKEKINKFIKDNDLDFSGKGSNLNGNCVILAGFACYLEIDSIGDLLLCINNKVTKLKLDVKTELERVFEYAYEQNYGEYWKTSDAHDEFIFE